MVSMMKSFIQEHSFFLRVMMAGVILVISTMILLALVIWNMIAGI